MLASLRTVGADALVGVAIEPGEKGDNANLHTSEHLEQAASWLGTAQAGKSKLDLTLVTCDAVVSNANRA